MLELEQLDVNLFRSRVNQINSNRSLFGGQILGQGLKAAALTVESDRTAHSLHGYFLLAGMSDIPVIYDVELTRDGGSFSTRRVVARQRAQTDLSYGAVVPSAGARVRARRCAGRRCARSGSIAEYARAREEIRGATSGRRSAACLASSSIVELKPVSPEDFFLRKARKDARSVLDQVAHRALPDDPLTQMAGLAYLSDYFLVSTALMQHPGAMLSGSSDDGEPGPRDVVSSTLPRGRMAAGRRREPFAGGARGLTRAQIFDRKRRLIASVAQEGLVRPIEKKRLADSGSGWHTVAESTVSAALRFAHCVI